MRLLVVDHFFAPDIEALRDASPPDWTWRVVPFDVLRDEALRIFSADVATGLEAFVRPEHERARERWAESVARWLHDEFTRDPFDVFVAPSDEFFYLRAVPDPLHALGVPFVCVHKETTISPNTMEVHSAWVRRYSAPIADRMTMCSDRHREYSERSGADPSIIDVTGQPRFDLYSHPDRWLRTTPYGSGGPSVLFLSYLSGLYHADGEEPRWAEMHRETERGLWELARRGWRVVIKPHPQQDWAADRLRIRDEVGDLLDDRVFLARPTDDMRPLLVSADVVVGFQTTALYEAMAAGRPIVYTGWHPDAQRLSGDMHSFADWDDVLEPVLDAGDFVAAVERSRGRTLDGAARAHALALAEEHLGPLDGRASERTIEVIAQEAARWEAARTPEQERLRGRLASRRRPLRAGPTLRRGLRLARRRIGEALGR